LTGPTQPRCNPVSKSFSSNQTCKGPAPYIASAPHGNPGTENFFGIVSVLQKKTRVKLRVTAKAA
jgi:hypothetical protein